ncbi:MAG: RlmE family RNA methyltransferase [Candidatus Thorarchaeota archaeon]|jgi:23S rRNA (uridine2552-2'-O)-methyltransferase
MGRPKKPRKKEHYYRAAKAKGYRARSAYKLRQIARKHKLLSDVDRVLDLCSSPGGWTQVIRELDSTIEIVAVDLNPMQPIERVTFIQGDILSSQTVDRIKEVTRGSVDLVVSDCAPKVTGNWELDVARQLSLAEATLRIGLELLGSGGRVLTKVFQGSGFQEFLRSAKSEYESVKLLKPDASRKTSAEIYLLATGPLKKSDGDEG